MALTQQRLDADWIIFCDRASTRQSVCAWKADHRLAAFENPRDVIVATQRGRDADRSELILRALAERAPGDTVAARTLLQVLLPGLRTVARKFQYRIGDDALAIAVGEAAIRISGGVPARRPGRVAANVVMDARAALIRAVNGPCFEPELEDAEAIEQVHASQEVIDLVVEARDAGIISQRAAALIITTRAHGFAIEEVARAKGVAACGLRQVRRRGEARLREWVPTQEQWCVSA